MPIVRRFVAQDQEDAQILKMDAVNRFIVNDSAEWEFLFGPSSALSNSDLNIQIAAQFDTDNFDGIKVIAYLYETSTASVSSSATCTFDIYKVHAPDWTETFIGSFSGSALPNSYFYKELSSVDLGGLELTGETTLMIEATSTRLDSTYRNRIYINHAGIYDSFLRLKRFADFLNVTKKDE